MKLIISYEFTGDVNFSNKFLFKYFYIYILLY